MKVDGRHWRSIWAEADRSSVGIIDQTLLPHRFATRKLRNLQDACAAITNMLVRGAPLIGATAAYGIALAARHDASVEKLRRAGSKLLATRPTAVNLRWAVGRLLAELANVPAPERADAAMELAARICDEDVATNCCIGAFGARLIREIARRKSGRPVDILTHCNAGWLACVDWGTATAPIYKAHDEGVPVHVWVDETRPRNQGAFLTAWELANHGVAHTVVADNAGGHLMQRGMVDLCLMGTDRTTGDGDVCNKIGTYLKALAAYDNNVPFYVALPSSSIDATIGDGVGQIEIESRSAEEITHICGLDCEGELRRVRLVANSPAANPAFDVTPARLVTALITERGTVEATRAALTGMFPELYGKSTGSNNGRLG